MTNLEESLSREILRTNRTGAYSFSTIVDCNTRKYHGLFVVPVPGLDDENHVLLSSLDPSVVQHGVEFNLGLHKYSGNNYSPTGHKYIREFVCDRIPTMVYRVGGVLLRKETVFQHYENRLLIRYTLVDSQGPTILRLRPFLAFRSVREFTHENGAASREYHAVKNGIKTCMYPGYPELFMQLSKMDGFVFDPDWYRGIEYPKEQERGYDSNEDLYVPGYFEVGLRKGEAVVFSAATTECKAPTRLRKLFDDEAGEKFKRDNFFHCLVTSAHQFLVHEGNDLYVQAGYPWFKCRARDTFIALPGLTLSIDETERMEQIMATAEKAIRDFIGGRPISVHICEMEHPDVFLWAIWALQQYAKVVGDEACLARYGKLIADMLEYLIAGRHPNLRLDGNGLVHCNGRDRAVTWMNSTIGGRPVVPRSGYIVEFNALWYNDLMFASRIMALGEGGGELAAKWEGIAAKAGVSFVETFLNCHGYLFDYVDGDERDWSVRPNMIFPVAFDYSPLSQEQKKGVLDFCTRELLTPKGLRSLSPKSGGYNPMYVGPQYVRDAAYHQGTAWPWLGCFYLEACIRLHKRARLSFVQRQLVGYEDEMLINCLCTIPELADGNPPFRARGAASFAMNVAEILRTLSIMEKYFSR